MEPSDGASGTIVFFKTRPDVITNDNLHTNVSVLSITDSPIKSLYHAVQKVFVPALLKSEKGDRGLDPKLQSLLSDLEAKLGSYVRKQDSQVLGSMGDVSDDNFNGEYWVGLTIVSSEDDGRYQLFIDCTLRLCTFSVIT